MRTSWRAAVLAVLISGAAMAQAPADNPEQTRRLIEQKIRLVEMLVRSPAAKGAAYGREAESAGLIEEGQRAIDDAKKALEESRYDDATALLDAALKSASAASRRLSAGGESLSDSAQRKSYHDMGEQVAMYRNSIADLARDGKSQPAAALLARVDGISGEAKQLFDAGRLGEANKKLADAYKVAVEELSRLRAGQEVVLSLNFDTPADEYAYEKKRFGSNEVLIDMMIGEGRAEGSKRQLVDTFVNEGRKLRDQAETQASAGQYAEAVTTMEKASAQMIRALQSMGVPVF